MPNTKLRGKGKSIQIEASVLTHITNVVNKYVDAGLDQSVEGFIRSRNIKDDKHISYENLEWTRDSLDKLLSQIEASQDEEQRNNLITLYKVGGGTPFHKWATQKIKQLRKEAEAQTTSENPTKVEHVIITREQLNKLFG